MPRASWEFPQVALLCSYHRNHGVGYTTAWTSRKSRSHPHHRPPFINFILVGGNYLCQFCELLLKVVSHCVSELGFRALHLISQGGDTLPEEDEAVCEGTIILSFISYSFLKESMPKEAVEVGKYNRGSFNPFQERRSLGKDRVVEIL